MLPYNFTREWMDTVRADCGETGLSSQYCLAVTIPHNLYLQTGDLGIARDNIENSYTYVDHLIDTPLSYRNDEGKQREPGLTGETGTLCDQLARVPSDGVSLGNALSDNGMNDVAYEHFGSTDYAPGSARRPGAPHPSGSGGTAAPTSWASTARTP